MKDRLITRETTEPSELTEIDTQVTDDHEREFALFDKVANLIPPHFQH